MVLNLFKKNIFIHETLIQFKVLIEDHKYKQKFWKKYIMLNKFLECKFSNKRSGNNYLRTMRICWSCENEFNL